MAARLTAESSSALQGKSLIEQEATLRARLESGDAKIDDALAADKSIEKLFALWVRLLDEYERVCDRLVAEGESLIR